MAKTKKEPEVAKEEPREEPKVDNTVDKLKIKKPKKFSKASEEKVTKIDIKEYIIQIVVEYLGWQII